MLANLEGAFSVRLNGLESLNNERGFFLLILETGNIGSFEY